MFVRFITSVKDPVLGFEYGIFQAADELELSRELDTADQAHIEELGKWFANNLREPSRFSKSRRPHRYDNGLSWFKEDALEMISKAYELIGILERAGVTVTKLRTPDPGMIIYEDEHQVVAVATKTSKNAVRRF